METAPTIARPATGQLSMIAVRQRNRQKLSRMARAENGAAPGKRLGRSRKPPVANNAISHRRLWVGDNRAPVGTKMIATAIPRPLVATAANANAANQTA